jgi:hypothetical protein
MPSKEERRLIPISESEVEQLRVIAAPVRTDDKAAFITSLADRWESGLTSEEAALMGARGPRHAKLQAFFLSDPEEESDG